MLDSRKKTKKKTGICTGGFFFKLPFVSLKWNEYGQLTAEPGDVTFTVNTRVFNKGGEPAKLAIYFTPTRRLL